jgi:hypothetical protein
MRLSELRGILGAISEDPECYVCVAEPVRGRVFFHTSKLTGVKEYCLAPDLTLTFEGSGVSGILAENSSHTSER